MYDLDFDDDDMTDSVENLREMRERRKSSDYHERKGSDSSYQSQDTSASPKFASPSHNSSKHRNTVYSQGLSELRPPSPINDGPAAVDDDEDLNASPEPEEAPEVNQLQNFNDCVLPGPVDMRTYSSFDSQPTPAQPAPYHNNLLGSLASEHQEPDIADDIEKEIQAAAKEKEITEPRVCLPDSRQQLKVKIKGPFLDANYMAAAPTAAPTSQQQQPAMPAVAPPDSVQGSGMASGSNMTSASASGTSNLRRMRKKELLRQYCSQDMNMDEPGVQSMPGHAIQPMAAPPINRTVISIPKAVASMTTIPTREDYKAVVDANNEKKRRKDKTPNFSNSYARRNNQDSLDYDETESLPERRRSVGSNGSNNSFSTGDVSQPLKRRGRAPKTPAIPTEVATTPKLKIKIGSNSTAEVALSSPITEKKNLRVRPPKKRHTVPAPSLAELRAESMKYRKKIMRDFGGGEDDNIEPAVVAPVAKKKKKKKRSSRSSSPAPTAVVPEVQEVKVITNEIAAPKLIIRFGNKGGSSSSSNVAGSASVSVTGASGEVGAQNQDRTAEGADGKVNERLAEGASPSLENQPSGATSAGKDVQQVPGLEPNLDSSQTSDASALRKVRTSKSAVPIRLKLSRCEEGYMMKAREETGSNTDGPANEVNPSPGNNHNMTDINPSTLPLSQDCEVR